MHLLKKTLMIFFLTVYACSCFAYDFQTLHAVFTRVFEGLPVEEEYSSIQEDRRFSKTSEILHLMSDEKKQAWLSFLQVIMEEQNKDHEGVYWTNSYLVEELEEEILYSDIDRWNFRFMPEWHLYEEDLKLMPPFMLELKNLSVREWAGLSWIVHFIREENRDRQGFIAATVLISVAVLLTVLSGFYYDPSLAVVAVTPEVGILLEQMKGKSLYEICTGGDKGQASSVGCRQYLKSLL